MKSCKKLAFLFIAMALILQATVPPTALAARNEITAFSGEEENNQATNGVNVLAMVLDVDPPRNCIPRGGICLVALSGCCNSPGCIFGICA
ncbi:hypothetical protein V6N13_040788 [Hibiscus sabdariffa]